MTIKMFLRRRTLALLSTGAAYAQAAADKPAAAKRSRRRARRNRWSARSRPTRKALHGKPRKNS